MGKISRKTSNTPLDKKDRPVYPIGIVAEMVGITEQTIRLYEKRGLIHPVRRNKHRYFSENDVAWLICIRDAIHKDKISIEGLIKLLNYAPCWEIRECPEEVRKSCTAFINKNKDCWEAKQHLCAKATTEDCNSCPVYIVGNKRRGKKENSPKGGMQ